MSEESSASEKTFQIYAPGYPDDGVSLTESQLQDALSSGQLKSCDLVWCDNAWRQLSDIFELPEFELPDYSDSGEQDIALKFSELPSSGIEPVLSHGAVAMNPWRKLARRLLFVNGKMRPIWQIAGVFFLLIALLFASYRYLVVPGFNRLFWRPAYVLLVNPYSRKCNVEFLGETHELPANGSLTFPDIFGCMPRVEVMYLKAPAEKTPKKINVKLYAGKDVLINPMGMCSFGILRQDGAGKYVDDSVIQAILREISEFREPKTALELGRKGQAVGKQKLLVCSDEPSIYSSDAIVTELGLDFLQLGLKRSPEYLEHEDMAVSDAAKFSRNLLTGVDFGGLKVLYRKGSRDVAECTLSIMLPGGAGALTPMKSHCKSIPGSFRKIEPITGKARCRIKFTAKQTIVTLEPVKRDFVIQRNQRGLKGTWSYEATLDMNSQKWSWRWHYDGEDDIKVAHLSMDLRSTGELANMSYTETRGTK